MKHRMLGSLTAFLACLLLYGCAAPTFTLGQDLFGKEIEDVQYHPRVLIDGQWEPFKVYGKDRSAVVNGATRNEDGTLALFLISGSRETGYRHLNYFINGGMPPQPDRFLLFVFEGNKTKCVRIPTPKKTFLLTPDSMKWINNDDVKITIMRDYFIVINRRGRILERNY